MCQNSFQSHFLLGKKFSTLGLLLFPFLRWEKYIKIWEGSSMSPCFLITDCGPPREIQLLANHSCLNFSQILRVTNNWLLEFTPPTWTHIYIPHMHVQSQTQTSHRCTQTQHAHEIIYTPHIHIHTPHAHTPHHSYTHSPNTHMHIVTHTHACIYICTYNHAQPLCTPYAYCSGFILLLWWIPELKTIWGKKGLIWLICPSYNPSLGEVKEKAQDRNLKAGLLGIPHITCNKGTLSQAKEIQHKAFRLPLDGLLAD